MSTTTGAVRVLPADVYDTLELSCLAFYGIGEGAFFLGDVPLCYVGHLVATRAIPNLAVVAPFGIDEKLSDAAVRAINKRKKITSVVARVSWKEYTRELGIVRGDS